MRTSNGPNPLDAQLGYAAAIQAAQRNKVRPAPKDIEAVLGDVVVHHPRRTIGPDCIKAIRDLSEDQTGNRMSFDFCEVQTVAGGMISPDIDVNKMHLPVSPEALTYGQLIRYADAEAAGLRERLDDMPSDRRASFLDRLLKEAAKDGRSMWIASTRPIRELLFPRSYKEERCDRVFYKATRSDGACGKQIQLRDLSPSGIQHFLGYAKRMAPTVEPDVITPTALTP